MPDASSWIVLKFGGTSVSTPDRWKTIAHIARRYRDDGVRPLLVCSALSGISDKLEMLADPDAEAAPDDVLAAIRTQHLELAERIGVDGETTLGASFAVLEERVEAVNASGRIHPQQHAEILAMGELMSTRLGSAFLATQGLTPHWMDAREVLRAEDEAHVAPARRYLSATCAAYPDGVLQNHLDGQDADVFITQGFIASNPVGETVLLGRGGSDTSAAYFAAKLEAERLEIWTDVPGMFTSNPRDIPSARLLRQLTYAEAQELATMGATVLHPRCLAPVRRYQIPLHVRSTDAPDLEGTVVSDAVPHDGPEVKAISSKDGVTVVSMETLGMWQQVGFLADVFQIFKHHGLSVDLVATSEANVTVTLDPMANALDPDVLDRLLHDLSAYCEPKIIESCAVVSLVGRHIRSMLHELGPAFEVFDEQNVHLVSQAASDLNFGFVVDEDQAERLVRQLHRQLFATRAPDATFGPSWQELFDAEPSKTSGAWWRDRRDELLSIVKASGEPSYVYDEDTLRRNARHVRRLGALDRTYYAVKANPHPRVLEILANEGIAFECVSPGEVQRVREVLPDLPADRILFQPNFAAIHEYADAFDEGVHVTLDNVEPLARHPEVFAEQDLFVRVDPGRGHGHHRHVRTAGAQSKFGIVPDELPRLRRLANQCNCTVRGLHVHVGSGITDAGTWPDIAGFLASLAADFPNVRTLNVGGGLGVPERPNATPLDLGILDKRLSEFKQQHAYDLWMEPGRFLVAEAGVMLAPVTQTKSKGSVHYVGLGTGMNSLIRPALYGSYHEIVNLSRLGEPLSMTADVVGPICESGDVLGRSRRLPDTMPGDIILIATAGAYGASMSNHYNLRTPARETILETVSA
ncbi:diaminopimelate decarboxylase [Longibacter salinarum]|uniref:Diaminopimelate decarboxylase n=1 Tax=Longibacter salinarum TaxID=1850348 RepID=A0A2A8CX04_9BACT|nr:bifunctional aspartate kinase/diaminopimelate decarboxylase [Longibacter salinarum]PEN13176.1 diaminopimelate decarboxylase [Longibacter salinarum]